MEALNVTAFTDRDTATLKLSKGDILCCPTLKDGRKEKVELREAEPVLDSVPTPPPLALNEGSMVGVV